MNLPLVDNNPLFPEIEGHFGFVANIFRYLANEPPMLNAIWSVIDSNMFQSDYVDYVTKEAIFVTVSRANGCEYCETAHRAVCTTFTPETVLSDSQQAMVKFAVSCAQHKRNDSLLDGHGITDEMTHELISLAAMVNYCNSVANGLRIPPDEELVIVARTLKTQRPKLDSILASLAVIDSYLS